MFIIKVFTIIIESVKNYNFFCKFRKKTLKKMKVSDQTALERTGGDLNPTKMS